MSNKLMIGKLNSTSTRHGAMIHSPEQSQTQDDRVPASPTTTSVSSTPAGGSPAGKTRAESSADPRLDTLLQLVTKTVRAKRQLDKEETWLMDESNRILHEQLAIDKAQEALDVRKDAHAERVGLAKRAREEHTQDMKDIDWSLQHPDDDAER